VKVLGFEQIYERLQTPKEVNKELFDVDEPTKKWNNPPGKGIAHSLLKVMIANFAIRRTLLPSSLYNLVSYK
jgi:hypothetical protein